MARLFDFFAILTAVVLVSGGAVLRGNHFYLDLASVDVFAVVTLAVFFLAWKTVETKSYVFEKVASFTTIQSEKYSKLFFIFSFLILLLAHIAKHWSLMTDGFDVSFVHQALFHPFSSPFLPADISVSGSALGEHLLFSLVPVALITQFIRVDEFLFVIQSLSIGLSLYWILFKSSLTPKTGGLLFLVTLILLANSSLRHALMFDFREDSFALMGLCIMIGASLLGRKSVYFLGLVIALLSKEHVFLVVLAFIPVIWFCKEIKFDSKTKKVLCASTFVFALGYGIFAFKFLLPYFNPNLHTGESPIVTRMHQFGNTPAEIIKNILITPSNWISVLANIFTKASILYIVKMLIPIAPFLFSLDALVFILPALAGMGINILTGVSGIVSMQFHYDLIVIPFLLTVLLIGTKHMQMIRTRKTTMLCLVALCFSGKWPVSELTHFWPSGSEISARMALLKLDSQIAVAIDTRLSSQVNQHNHLYVLDANCVSVAKKSESDFKGYIVDDRKNLGSTACLIKPNHPIFFNEQIAIFDNR